jgi:DNA-binding response OmpR family regulator
MMQYACAQSQNDCSSNKTILVVEDDDGIGTMLVEALAQETPYKVLLANNAVQALQMLHEIKPSLFITDYHLPFMNGIEFYDRLRSKRELARTPAIIISASLPVEEVYKRQLIGFHKPFELDELLDTVEHLMH